MHPKWIAAFLNEMNGEMKLSGSLLNFFSSLMLTTMLQHAVSHGFDVGDTLPGARHPVIIYDLVKPFNVV